MKIITFIYIFTIYILCSPGFLLNNGKYYLLCSIGFSIIFYFSIDYMNNSKEFLSEKDDLNVERTNIDGLVNKLDKKIDNKINEVNVEIYDKISFTPIEDVSNITEDCLSKLQELEKYKLDISELQDTLAYYKGLPATKKTLQNTVSKIEKKELELKEKIKTLNDNIENKKSIVTSKQNTIGSLVETVTDLSGNNVVLNGQINEKEQLILKEMKTIDDQKGTINTLNNTISGKNEAISSKTSEIDTIINELIQLTNRYKQKIKNDLNETDNQLNQTENQLNQKESQLNQIENQLNQKNSQLTASNNNINNLTQQTNSNNSTITTLNNDIASAKSAMIVKHQNMCKEEEWMENNKFKIRVGYNGDKYLKAHNNANGRPISTTYSENDASDFYFDRDSFPGYILITTTDKQLFLRLFGVLSANDKSYWQVDFIRKNDPQARTQLGNITNTSVYNQKLLFNYTLTHGTWRGQDFYMVK